MRRVRRRGRERFRPLGLWELRDGAALCNEIRDAGSCLYQVRMTAKSARGGGDAPAVPAENSIPTRIETGAEAKESPALTTDARRKLYHKELSRDPDFNAINEDSQTVRHRPPRNRWQAVVGAVRLPGAGSDGAARRLAGWR